MSLGCPALPVLGGCEELPVHPPIKKQSQNAGKAPVVPQHVEPCQSPLACPKPRVRPASPSPSSHLPSSSSSGPLCGSGWSPALPSHPWGSPAPALLHKQVFSARRPGSERGKPPAVQGRGEPAQQCPTERRADWGGGEPGTRPSAVDIFSPNASPFLFALPSSRRGLSQKAKAGSASMGQDPRDPSCLATPSKVSREGLVVRGSPSALLQDSHHPCE